MILIRKATANEAGDIAYCFLLAMEEIVYKFTGSRNPETAKAFMLHFVERENNQYSYQNCWVAEEDQKVVAAVNVYDGAYLEQLRQPVIEYIQNRFHTNLQWENETQAGEYYIDSLGVNPGQQGKGIGSQMLQFLIREYVVRQGQTLGLLVDEENPGAKRLYIKLGFTTVGRKTLFGKNMEHLQIKG